MKFQKIKTFALGLLVASIAITQYSCEADWLKEYDDVTLKQPSTATVAVNTIKDSTAMLDYSLSKVGRLFIVVVPGNDETAVPDASTILTLKTAGSVFKKQVVFNDAAALSASVKITGLVQNTSYKVFALPVNEDGVQGTIVTTDAFTTSDNYAPTLSLSSGISPSVSSSAAQTLTFSPVLTFSEPIVLNSTFTIQMGYRNAVTGVITNLDVPSNKISISGNKLTIAQPSTSTINGQYVFLSIAAGSIKDRAGNVYAGVTSGITGGLLTGIYWRTAFAATTAQQVLPTEPVTSNTAMKIVFDYPIKMRLPVTAEGGYDQKKIVVRYTYPGSTLDMEVPVANVAVVQDTLVQITLPRTPVYGETVTFMMAEGAMRNSYGNPSAAVAFGAKSWFISYGYTRNLVVGNYTIGSLVSYFDGPLATTYSVTLAAHATDPNKVLIKGFMGSNVDIVAVFNGDFATFTINPAGAYGQILTFPAGHPLADYEIELWNPFEDSGVITGTISSNGNLTIPDWGLYYYTTDDDGWIDIYTESTWTKGTKSDQNFIYSLPKAKAKGKTIR